MEMEHRKRYNHEQWPLYLVYVYVYVLCIRCVQNNLFFTMNVTIPGSLQEFTTICDMLHTPLSLLCISKVN